MRLGEIVRRGVDIAAVSSSLSEKAMAWTTKSSLPQRLRDLGEDRVDGGGVGDVAMADDDGRRVPAASGSTRFFSASP